MDHLLEKIMILERWSLDAFIVYIRPQVMEWTSIMSKDMARAGSFTDLGTQARRGKWISPTIDTSIVGRSFPRFTTQQHEILMTIR